MLIFSATEIPPSQQDSESTRSPTWSLRDAEVGAVKFGYPPKPLPATSGLLSSIPITRGEQVIVTSAPSAAAPSSRPEPTPPPSIKPLNQTLSAPTPPSAANEVEVGEESVALPGDAGYLQLRVVPDDNSCLFSALGVIFEGGIESAQKLRRGGPEISRETHVDTSQSWPTRSERTLPPFPTPFWGESGLVVAVRLWLTDVDSHRTSTFERCLRRMPGAEQSSCQSSPGSESSLVPTLMTPR